MKVLVLAALCSLVRAKCSGDACALPCQCDAGDSGTDTECVNGALTAVPCHINRKANGLYLSNNTIQDIVPGDLDGLDQLQYLFADHNRLTVLRKGALSGLTSLGELFMPDNRIALVEQGALPSSINYLELNNNTLSAVPPLPAALATLALTNNSIGPALPRAAFDAVRGNSSALADIKLGGNRIETVESGAFDGLPGLATYYGRLCLERNPLNCCGLEWLRGMDALDSLCPGEATCDQPRALRGVALKKTSGTICPHLG